MKSSRGAARRGASGSPCSCRASTPAPERDGPAASFPRSVRIVRGSELRRIARSGKRLRTDTIDVRVVASLLRLEHARVGLVVPRHGRSVVDRNRLKRRLRELARTELLPGAPPVDAVLHARPAAYALSFDQLRATTRRIRSLIERIAPSLLAAATTERV